MGKNVLKNENFRWLMVVFQENSKHQDSNARNETKKTSPRLQLRLLDYVKFWIENLMKDIRYQTCS